MEATKTTIFLTMNPFFNKKWVILCNDDGKMFTDMDKAIEFVRSNFSDLQCGLSTHSQMLLGTVNWDNF